MASKLEASQEKNQCKEKFRTIIDGHFNKVRVERYLNIKEILKK